MLACVARRNRGKRSRKGPTPRRRPERKGHPRRPQAVSSAAENQLFFLKIRRSAKWSFILLAFAFAGGFLFFGIGSGGTGIGDLFNSGGFSSHSGTSISSLEKKALAHPRSAPVWERLASAYQIKGKTDLAIKALGHYVALKPHDQAALQLLANYNLTRANSFQTRIDKIQSALPTQNPTTLSGKLAQVLGDASPVDTQIQTEQQAVLQPIQTEQRQYLVGAFSVYKTLGVLQPKNAYTQYELGNLAINQGDYKTALGAFKAYLKCPQADKTLFVRVRQEIKLLEPVVNPKTTKAKK